MDPAIAELLKNLLDAREAYDAALMFETNIDAVVDAGCDLHLAEVALMGEEFNWI